ncbi:protein FAR1-RELATED SEQUENCE [Trifolium repens]|nr:protein FAR1-RELATED SEQUENCE [Trifolium repens]
MGGEKPKTILTDQDAAMAISLVMPETFHGLCTWHIRENAIRHVNHLYQKSSQFRYDFEACIDLHEEEDEFLNAWNTLLLEHKVSDDSWLHSIFRVKEKWAWAYVRKTFTAGMRSTQLSESFNADLKNHLKSDLNLVQFFTHFERVVNGKRNNESEADFESRHKLPKLKIKKAHMLVQAGNIYTPKIFEEFQEEYDEFLGTCIKNLKDGLYIVINYDDNKEHKVIGNFEDQMVACDCRKFETHGILCSHALKVLDAMNIKLIPSHYILKRWTRDARSGSNRDWKGRHIDLDIKAHFMKRYNDLCPRMVKLTNRASETHEGYTFLSKVYEESNKIIDMLAKKPMDEESIGMCHVSISIENGEAKGIKKRECSNKSNKRPKSWNEKLARKRKANMSQKKKKTQENLEKSAATNDGAHTLHSSHTLTQLLTQPLDYNSLSLSSDHVILDGSQSGGGSQVDILGMNFGKE